jgi:predicted DNA-binding transcriptional regulator YafY
MQSFSQTRVRLEMNLRAKDLLCEEFPLAVPDVREENGKWVLDTMVSRMEGVGRFVIGLAADIKVIDSPELEEYVRDYADKYLNKND